MPSSSCLATSGTPARSSATYRRCARWVGTLSFDPFCVAGAIDPCLSNRNHDCAGPERLFWGACPAAGYDSSAMLSPAPCGFFPGLKLFVHKSARTHRPVHAGRTARTCRDPKTVSMQVGELFILGFFGKTIPPWLREFAARFGLGGVILFDYSVRTRQYDNNIDSPAQLRELCAEIAALPSVSDGVHRPGGRAGAAAQGGARIFAPAECQGFQPARRRREAQHPDRKLQ